MSATGPQHPKYHRWQVYLTLPSRAGWSNRATGPSGTSWGAACLLPSAGTSFQGQAGPWHPCFARSQKSATCTHTCSSHVSNTLTCACTIPHPERSHTARPHCPRAPCTHTCSKTLAYAHRCTLEHVHSLKHTHMQSQEPTITDLCLPKVTQGTEYRPTRSHTHGYLLKTGADPNSHDS